MELGRNTIHKLGKRVREAYGDGTGHVEDEDLKLLQDYRLSFRDDIAAVFQRKQGETLVACFGQSTVAAAEEAGLRVDIKAPTPECPSIATAIEKYLDKQLS